MTATDIQKTLDQRIHAAPGNGIILGLIDHGKTSVYRSGVSGTSRPLDRYTLFEIGSVTKTFTASLLATMVLDHSVNLDDPVSRYVPAKVRIPSRGDKQITLLNLATQHSGLPRLPTNLDPTASDPYAAYSIDDLYQFLDSYQLTRAPGAEFEYSNLGVGLLGDALANKSALAYSQLLQRRILSPLGMTQTFIAAPHFAVPRRMAQGHDGDGNPVKPWTFLAIAPAGGIVSSLDDMLKYVRANLGQGKLGAACLFAQRPRDTIPGGRIGLVWWTGNLTHAIHHGGDTDGFHAWVAVSPDHTKGVVVLSNGGAPLEDIAVHAIDAWFPVATPRPTVTLDAATLQSYVGTYTNAAGIFTITLSGDKLMARLSGQDAFRIYASAKDHFFYRVVNAELEFTRNVNGHIDGLILHQNGRDVVFSRSSEAVQPSTPQPTFPPAITLDPQTLKEYVGSYATPGGGPVFTVTASDTGLVVQLTGQPAVPVYASAKDHFYYKVVNAQIDFERDNAGKVNRLVLHQNGATLSADRVVVLQQLR